MAALELCKSLLLPQDDVADTWLALTGASCTSCLNVLMSNTFHTCILRAMHPQGHASLGPCILRAILSKPCVLQIMLELLHAVPDVLPMAKPSPMLE